MVVASLRDVRARALRGQGPAARTAAAPNPADLRNERRLSMFSILPVKYYQ
jgi:hypothetical protein